MSINPVKSIILSGIAAVTLIIILYAMNTTVPIGERPKQFSELGGNFQLSSLEGRVNLADYQGKIVVLYFGFLNCAEVCPSSMGVMSTAFKRLKKETYGDVQGFFISVDPSRDDLDSLNDFSQYFDKQIQGLTGTEAEIDAVTDQYGVYVDIVDLEGSVLNYTVDHVSRFFIVNPLGELVDSMSHTTTPSELAAKIERVHDYHAALKKES